MTTRHRPFLFRARAACALLAPFLLLAAGHARAALSARAQLDAFAAGLKSVSADFSQQTVDANGDPGRSADGTLQLAAPRLFRWQVTRPYHQLIVADGARAEQKGLVAGGHGGVSGRGIRGMRANRIAVRACIAA